MSLYDTFSYPPLPSQPEPSLAERRAQAKKLRGQIPYWKINKMLTIIEASAKDCAFLEIKVSGVPKIATIQEIVAEHFYLTVDEMISNSRLQQTVRPRMIAIYLSHILTRHSFSEIGARFNREHSTVMYSVEKIARRIAADMAFAEEIETLKRMLHGR